MWPPKSSIACWLADCHCTANNYLPDPHRWGQGNKEAELLIKKKKKLVPGIICQFRLALNMRPLTACRTRVHTESASLRLGLAGLSCAAIPTSAEDRQFFAQEARLLHITTSKSVCCTACDCYFRFTYHSSESHWGISLHKHKLSSKLRIVTWFHMTLLTAENTSNKGPLTAASSPHRPHYKNKEQSLFSWSKYLLTPLTPTEVAWQVRHDFTCITVCFK